MKPKADFRISALRPAHLDHARLLLKAYAATLSIDLDAQGFADEMANLPGPYAPPRGCFLLAFGRQAPPLGAIALKPLAPRVGEIKRLYVAHEARGLGLGRVLVGAILGEARRIGYRELKLDTLPQMKEAIALYRSMGFAPTAPYGSFPYPGLVCLGRLI